MVGGEERDSIRVLKVDEELRVWCQIYEVRIRGFMFAVGDITSWGISSLRSRVKVLGEAVTFFTAILCFGRLEYGAV